MRTNLSDLYWAIRDATNHRGDMEGWIASVLMGRRKPITRLKNMLAHIRQGRVFTDLSFTMPYDGFAVDGVGVKLTFLDRADSNIDDHRLK